MRNAIAGCVVALGLLASGGSALAQNNEITYVPGFDPEQFAASADPGSVALMDGARVLSMRSFAAGLIFNVGGPPLDVCVTDASDPDGGCTVEGDIINTRLRADLVAIFGFGRFDVRALLPMVLHQSSDFAPGAGMESLGSAGIGDLRLGGRVKIAEVADFGFAGDLSFTLPTGGGDNFIGDSGLLVDPKLIADWRKGRVAAVASFGYRFRQEPVRLANLYVDDELTWSVGADYAIQEDKLTAGVAMFGHIGLMSDSETPMEGVESALAGEEFPIEVLASSRYFVSEKIAIEAGVGTALTSGYGAPPFRVLAGLRYIDRKKEVKKLVVDTDGDGIVDDDDACPKDPEDIDEWEDLDGCPEADNDKDGILDAADTCPIVAEDMDSFEDTDGCPEADNDKDGMIDDEDGCPIDPEDIDGFGDEDGCPDPDNDADGLLDGVDKCPDEPETFNSIDDEDGCPDEREIAIVTETGIDISQKIFFDTNRARIKKRSYKVIDSVAKLLKLHDKLEIRIEGHTDDEGTDAQNLALSQKRAEAVRDYLVKKGIDAKRLTPEGFGESRRMSEGTDADSRADNRRVEFVIVGGQAEAVDGGTAPNEPTPEDDL